MLSWPSTAVAQDLYFHFSGTTLSEALSDIATSTGSNIAFDSEKLAQSRVNCTLSGSDTGKLLEDLLEGSDFIFLHQFDSYLIIDKKDEGDIGAEPPGSIRGVLLDASTGDALPWANIFLPSLNTHLYRRTDPSLSRPQRIIPRIFI
jgi:hypothetical protein